ncbi:MAG: class I SAM-dependent methyltransferase [Betaproteobacteria bacterium]|nr:class I SAM-dependent methyltransferase [Betaproteobacteria bacterium]
MLKKPVRFEPVPRLETFANDLERLFFSERGRPVHKWRHYLEIYDRHFAALRGKPLTLVEIGVYKGGSLQLWRSYFGADAAIWGVDISSTAEEMRAEGFNILIGDQGDAAFLQRVRDEIPRPDILIDDGGHSMQQQIATFEALFPHVKDDGIYLCEDTHTSYWEEFGGGFRGSSFLEYSKQWIDALHAWHSRDPRLTVGEFTRSAWAMHYYDSMLVIEKRRMQPPEVLRSDASGVYRKMPR